MSGSSLSPVPSRKRNPWDDLPGICITLFALERVDQILLQLQTVLQIAYFLGDPLQLSVGRVGHSVQLQQCIPGLVRLGAEAVKPLPGLVDLLVDPVQLLLLPGQLEAAPAYQSFKLCGKGLPCLLLDQLDNLVRKSHAPNVGFCHIKTSSQNNKFATAKRAVALLVKHVGHKKAPVKRPWNKYQCAHWFLCRESSLQGFSYVLPIPGPQAALRALRGRTKRTTTPTICRR